VAFAALFFRVTIFEVETAMNVNTVYCAKWCLDGVEVEMFWMSLLSVSCRHGRLVGE
jgi:hypothetical protein